jgi:hypothetical protein
MSSLLASRCVGIAPTSLVNIYGAAVGLGVAGEGYSELSHRAIKRPVGLI